MRESLDLAHGVFKGHGVLNCSGEGLHDGLAIAYGVLEIASGVIHILLGIVISILCRPPCIYTLLFLRRPRHCPCGLLYLLPQANLVLGKVLRSVSGR